MRVILRLMLLPTLLLLAPLANAQRDSSLTRDFAKLSAKERAKVAKEEQDASMVDERYQGVMKSGEDLFQQRRYDEALERFKEARSIRPYNVYPKVKIQDLEALIAKREAAQEQELAPPAPKPPEPLAVEAPPVKAVVVPKPVARPVATSLPIASERTSPEKDLPDEVQERIYREGRAVILERKVAYNGHVEVYRKVVHHWGEVVHFKDGSPISERVWKDTFGDR